MSRVNKGRVFWNEPKIRTFLLASPSKPVQWAGRGHHRPSLGVYLAHSENYWPEYRVDNRRVVFDAQSNLMAFDRFLKTGQNQLWSKRAKLYSENAIS